MIVVAEVVGLPLLAALFVSWVRTDDADARRMDAILDAREVTSGEVGRDRPWWETEPSIVDENREGRST